MNKLYKKFCLSLLLVFTILPFYSLAYSNQATKVVTTAIGKSVAGTMDVLIEDYFDDEGNAKETLSKTKYLLHADDNNSYSLIFTDKVPSDLKTGQRVTVNKGRINTAEMHSTSKELFVLEKDVRITRDLPKHDNVTRATRKNALVLMLNFQDKPNEKPWTQQDAKDTLTAVNRMFLEFSYRQTSIGGNVVGWLTIPMNSTTTCDDIRDNMPALALQAAKSEGVATTGYTNFIYMFPRTASCGWAALGNLGGYPAGTTWFNGVNNAAVMTHELGHNLGLYHSHSLECQGGTMTGTCSVVDYGDYADTMGSPGAYNGPHFNAYQKEHIGWLNVPTAPPIITVKTSGNYLIDAYETTNFNTKALKIETKADNQYSKNYYYVEFRQGIGFDSRLAACTDCNFTKGVIVHHGNDKNFNSSDLLDMSPNVGSKGKMVALTPGMSYTDPAAPNGGVTIYLDSISAAGAKVKVTFGAGDTPPPAACTLAAPSISISPGYAKISRGSSQKYTVTLKNNNTGNCAPATFNVAVAQADNLIPVTLDLNTATIASGASQAITVTASTTDSSPKGYYDVRVDAFNAAAIEQKAFTYGSLVVE